MSLLSKVRSTFDWPEFGLALVSEVMDRMKYTMYA